MSEQAVEAPKQRKIDTTWLEWKDPKQIEAQYQVLDKREKAVFLKIKTHRPESLQKVKRKQHTHLETFLDHGVIPKISDQDIKAHVKALENRGGHSRETVIVPGTVGEKMYVNSKETPWQQRRTREWTDYNFRTKNDWSQFEQVRDVSDIKAELMRKRNKQIIYKEDKLKEYRNMIQNLDKGVVKPITLENSLKLNEEIQSIADKTQIQASKKSENDYLKQRPKSAVNPQKKAKKSQRQQQADALYTTEELRQLRQLPQEQQDKIMESIAKKQKKPVETGADVADDQIQRKEKEESTMKMIKVWDGYKYKYSPVKISFGKPVHFDQQQVVSAVNEDTGNDLPVKQLIHHAKQNGYSSVWYDAINGVHPKCRDLREVQNQRLKHSPERSRSPELVPRPVRHQDDGMQITRYIVES